MMLLGGFLVEIPISMFLVSLLLQRRFSRPLNLIASVLTIGVLMAEPPSDLDDVFFKIIEFTAVIAIVWTSWRWRQVEEKVV